MKRYFNNLSEKNQKNYSLRKYKVGVISALVSSIFIFGLYNDTTEAAEVDSSQFNSTNGKAGHNYYSNLNPVHTTNLNVGKPYGPQYNDYDQKAEVNNFGALNSLNTSTLDSGRTGLPSAPSPANNRTANNQLDAPNDQGQSNNQHNSPSLGKQLNESVNSYGAATSPNGTQVPSLSALPSTQNKQPAVQPNRNNNSFRNSLGGNHSDLSNWLLPSKPKQKGPSLAQRQQLGSAVGGVLGKDVVSVDQHGTVTLSDGTQVPFIGSFPSSPSQPNSNKVVPSQNNNQPPADIKPISPFGSPYGSGNGVVSPDLADWILPARPKNNSVANSNPQNNNSVASNNSVSPKDRTVHAGGNNAVNVSVNNANSVQPSNNTQGSQSQPSSNKISNASANAQPLSSQPNNNKNFDPIDDQEVAPDYLEETIDLKNLGAEWDGVVKDLEAQNASQDFAEETIDLNNLGQEWDGVAKDLVAQNVAPSYPEETIDLNNLGAEWDDVNKDLGTQNVAPDYAEETIDLNNLGPEWNGVNKDLESQKVSPDYPEETIDLNNLGQEWDGVLKDLNQQVQKPQHDIDQQSDVKHNQDHKQNVGNSEKPLDDNLLEDGNSSNSQELPNDNQQQSGNQLPKIKNMKPEANPQVDTKKPQNMSIQDGQNKVVVLPKDASSKAAINSKANPSDNNVNKDGKLAVDQSEANKVINSDSRVAKTKSIIQLTPIVTNVKKAQNVVTANNKVHTATTQKMQKVKASTSTTKNKQHKANKQLPKTGESTPATIPILGAVLSLLGTLTLIGRRKKQQD